MTYKSKKEISDLSAPELIKYYQELKLHYSVLEEIISVYEEQVSITKIELQLRYQELEDMSCEAEINREAGFETIIMIIDEANNSITSITDGEFEDNIH